MYISIHVYIHIYTYTCVYIYIYIYIYTYIHTYIHTYHSRTKRSHSSGLGVRVVWKLFMLNLFAVKWAQRRREGMT